MKEIIIKGEIAKIAMKPIIDRLLQRAAEEVAENFCKPHCGHVPEGRFCNDAYQVYGCVLSALFKFYGSHN